MTSALCLATSVGDFVVWWCIRCCLGRFETAYPLRPLAAGRRQESHRSPEHIHFNNHMFALFLICQRALSGSWSSRKGRQRPFPQTTSGALQPHFLHRHVRHFFRKCFAQTHNVVGARAKKFAFLRRHGDGENPFELQRHLGKVSGCPRECLDW